MKLSRIMLALAVAAPFAAANAGITITPLVGYHFNNLAGHADTKQQRILGAELNDDVLFGGAVGVELTPWLQAELEYLQSNTDAESSPKTAGQPWDAKRRSLSGNLLIEPFAAASNFGLTNSVSSGFNRYNIRPYILAGVGQSRIDTNGTQAVDTIGNAGLGLLLDINEYLSARGEVRAVGNFDERWVDGQALFGLQAVLGGHLRPAAPVVEVQPQPQPVEPQAEPEQPQEITEDLKMELRVFFDINKSNIKAQYKPEIAKVAEKLGEFPNATAQIDGHTDNTGPRKLNERLSLARANSVKASLVNEFGVDANRLTTQGFAWDQPIADNNTKEGRAMNRRVFATITGSRTVLQQPAQ